jgi:deoxyribonuclease-4
MGKRNQLGTLEEVMNLCLVDESMLPTIDFGHINALGRGCLKGRKEYKEVLDTIKNSIGEYRLKNMHCHFSRIEFTDAGEKKHHRLCDTMHGPEFEPLGELLAEYDLSPVIICESRGTMAEDALELKRIYNSFKKF